jgi:hypothetical protein
MTDLAPMQGKSGEESRWDFSAYVSRPRRTLTPFPRSRAQPGAGNFACLAQLMRVSCRCRRRRHIYGGPSDRPSVGFRVWPCICPQSRRVTPPRGTPRKSTLDL